MSAVLQSSALPASINMENLTAYIDSEIKKGIEKALPAAIEKILSDPENPLFIKAIESVLAVSENKILQRLYTHDVMLGLKEPAEDDYYVSIPKRIEAIEKNAVIATEKPTEEKKDINPIIAKTTLTQKASALTEYLEKKTKPNWTGKIVLENHEMELSNQ